MKPPGITVHFTQTETTKGKRCSWESLKKFEGTLKTSPKAAWILPGHKFTTSNGYFSGWGQLFQKEVLVDAMKGESAYKAKIKCPKEPAWEQKYISLKYGHGNFKNHEGAQLEMWYFPFAVAPLWFAHALTPAEQEAQEGTLSCQGAAAMLRGCKVLPGTAGPFSSVPLHLQPSCLFSKAVSSHMRGEWIWQGWHFPSKAVFWWERKGGSAEKQQTLVLEREMSPTQWGVGDSPKLCEARREPQVRLCSSALSADAFLIWWFIYWFIAVPFTEICRIV